MRLGFVPGFLVAILGAGGARAAIITVTSLADDTVIDGQVTLREALIAANTDTSVDGSAAGSGADDIVFAVGPGTILLSGSPLPVVQEDLTVTGPGPGRLAIDGGQESRLLEVPAGIALELSGLTLRNGRVVGGDGGGILSAGGLILDNCTLAGNAATGNGGAVRIEASGTLDVINSTFSGNSALNGGGVSSAGSLVIVGSTFSGNFTGGIAPFTGGGGAVLGAASTIVANSTFTANSAGNGGAIVMIGATFLVVSTSTVAGNTAILTGGGIASSSATVLLQATIVAENQADAIDQDVAAAVDAISQDNVIGVDTGLTGITDGVNGNQIGTAASPLDPGLGPLQNNGGPTATRALLPGSPALEGGSFDTCAADDQRGLTRPQDGDGDGVALCDVGAYEAFAVAPAGVSFFALTPCRIADTRGPAGPSGAPALAANATRFFPAAVLCGVPASARAVALNVTVVGPTDAGNLRLYPAGAAAPQASTINFAAGRVRANSALVPVGADRQISVRCDMPPGSTGTVHLVLDVFGYFE